MSIVWLVAILKAGKMSMHDDFGGGILVSLAGIFWSAEKGGPSRYPEIETILHLLQQKWNTSLSVSSTSNFHCRAWISRCPSIDFVFKTSSSMPG
jgi:hypothetical protein